MGILDGEKPKWRSSGGLIPFFRIPTGFEGDFRLRLYGEDILVYRHEWWDKNKGGFTKLICPGYSQCALCAYLSRLYKEREEYLEKQGIPSSRKEQSEENKELLAPLEALISKLRLQRFVVKLAWSYEDQEVVIYEIRDNHAEKIAEVFSRRRQDGLDPHKLDLIISVSGKGKQREYSFDASVREQSLSESVLTLLEKAWKETQWDRLYRPASEAELICALDRFTGGDETGSSSEVDDELLDLSPPAEVGF